jgi:hypothetical protein
LAASHCHVQRNGIVGNALARHREYLALKKLVTHGAPAFQSEIFFGCVAARWYFGLSHVSQI